MNELDIVSIAGEKVICSICGKQRLSTKFDENVICPICGKKVKHFESKYYCGYSWDCYCLPKQYDNFHKTEEEKMLSELAERQRRVHGSIFDSIPDRHNKNIFKPDMNRISPEIKELILNWEKNKNKNIYICGPSGIGKSFDLAWLLTQLTWSPADEIAWGTPQSINNAIHNNNDLDFWKEARVLVLEDLQECLGNQASAILDILDGRENLENRRTWASGTLSPAALENKLQNKSLFTRLFQRKDPYDKGQFLEIAKVL